jgi:hypothetical protein
MVKVAKTKVAVTVYTPTHRIDGTYFMVPGSRLIDDLNARQKQFIPLSDVQITSLHDGVEMRSRYDFIALSVQSIMLFCPHPKMGDIGRQTLEVEPRVPVVLTTK